MALSADERREIERFPAALRALLEEELAAGNAIIEITHGFPAPPVGACIMLARPVSTRPRTGADDLTWRGRQSPLCSGEWTDAEGFFFLLEPPAPPPPMPDMDAIRNRHSPAAAAPPPLPPPFSVEIDVRGEMLTCREGERTATVICTFGGDPCIVPRTLSGWWHEAERRPAPMTEDEKAALIARIADYCRRHHGMTRLVVEGSA